MRRAQKPNRRNVAIADIAFYSVLLDDKVCYRQQPASAAALNVRRIPARPKFQVDHSPHPGASVCFRRTVPLFAQKTPGILPAVLYSFAFTIRLDAEVVCNAKRTHPRSGRLDPGDVVLPIATEAIRQLGSGRVQMRVPSMPLGARFVANCHRLWIVSV